MKQEQIDFYCPRCKRFYLRFVLNHLRNKVSREVAICSRCEEGRKTISAEVNMED